MTDEERENQRKAKAKAHAERARRATAVNVKSGPPPQPPRKVVRSWRENPEWPARNPDGYVFLARAVENIGHVLFGDDWTGDEAPAPLPDTSSYYRRIYSPLESERKATARFEKVQNTIAAAAEAKQLLTAGRPKNGGKMIGLRAHHWNTENLGSRFYTCQIDADEPFGLDPSWWRDPHWIYVTAESLETFAKTLTNKPASSGRAPVASHEVYERSDVPTQTKGHEPRDSKGGVQAGDRR